jgi:erythromycin esterase-like protein
MSNSTTIYPSLEDWVACEAISFAAEREESFQAAIGTMISALGDDVELLGMGEPLHGAEEFLNFRNRLFRRLAEAHGYCAIAIESSFPRAWLVNEYISGRGRASFDEVQEKGFSHGFGHSQANRELVEWMRSYNAEPGNRAKLRFYGFDSPTEMTGTDSPRQLLCFALDYLAALDRESGEARRQRIEALLGSDADWENPAALMDPSKSIGLSPAAAALRIEVEDLLTELRIRGPELAARSDEATFFEAVQHAALARQFLSYHAALARDSSQRLVELLGIRDLMMADNLAYMVRQERGRGRVLAFAHNKHLQYGPVEWQLGPNRLVWWPAGAHLRQIVGKCYAVLGMAVGCSETHGIGKPAAGTLEAYLSSTDGSARLIPTHGGQNVPQAALRNLPVRCGSTANSTYFPFCAQSFTDFDWLAMLSESADKRR